MDRMCVVNVYHGGRFVVTPTLPSVAYVEAEVEVMNVVQGYAYIF